MSTQVVQSKEARQKLRNGVNALADAVKSTLGPSGKTVMIQESGRNVPRLTKDGVTVAQHILRLSDTIENMGAQLVKQVANQTVNDAGDGTTTSIVLAQHLINKGLDALDEGVNANDLVSGMRKATKAAVEAIGKNAKVIGRDQEQLAYIATISSNNDAKIGKMVSQIICEVGENGIVSAQPSLTGESYAKKEEGIVLQQGYLNHNMRNDASSHKILLTDVDILICENKISDFKEIENIVGRTVDTNRSLLIISEDMDGSALANINANVQQGRIRACAIRMPQQGIITKDAMDDIAIVIGGRVAGRSKGDNLRNLPVTYIGHADRVVITHNSTTIIGAAGKEYDINKRAEMIKEQMASCQPGREKEALHSRLAKLSSSIGIIYIGGVTKEAIFEEMDRVDDAMRATLAAIDEGVVPGGGVALLNAAQSLQLIEAANEGEQKGIDIISSAICEPANLILSNAGVADKDGVLLQVISTGGDFGFNSKSMKYENFFETGVMDPAKVTRIALESASSISELFLSTGCVVMEG